MLDHGFWLDDVERFTPARPKTTEQIPERSVAPTQTGTARISLEDLDLVAEGGVFEGQGRPSSERRQQEAQEYI